MSNSIPLTFAELEVGEHFIAFPSDGDDSGHGGYRRGQRLFRKISAEDRTGPSQLVENAEATGTGTRSHMPLGMRILKIIA
ncbi:MAG TPA: hypothetical protein VL426_02445 [Candidatus Binatia bacterium]|jgi:hypothetical protein|nr:hypothetical protein [Candidatus Binatia bacterium]